MRSARPTLLRGLLFTIFLIASVLAIAPMLAILISSFRPAADLIRYGMNFGIDVDELSFDNYIYLFTSDTSYFQWYFNSVWVTCLLVVISVGLSSMVGYGLAVYRFRGNRAIFLCVLFTLMIPFEILMLPLYKLISGVGLMNTHLAVVLPLAVSPIAVFFFRQYALSLPTELLDAARMDGCSEPGIFIRVMAPLMRPAFGAMVILLGLFSWNNFLWPLVVLRSNELFTLPIGLASLLTPYGNNYDALISGSVLTVVPLLVLFIAFQRYFVSGMTAGSVKE